MSLFFAFYFPQKPSITPSVAHRPRNHTQRKIKSHQFSPDLGQRRGQGKKGDWPDIIYGKNPVYEALRAGNRENYRNSYGPMTRAE